MKIVNTLHEHSGSPKKILFHFTFLIQKCVSTAFNQTRLPALQFLLEDISVPKRENCTNRQEEQQRRLVKWMNTPLKIAALGLPGIILVVTMAATGLTLVNGDRIQNNQSFQ
jgi:hypothetical protein